MGTIHTATINSLDYIDTKCPSSSTYTASSGSQTTYEVHCGKVNNGVNITSLHLTNVTACIEACASISSTQNCTGVVFDSSMQGGYENCYLQNTTGVVNDQAQATYAIVAGSGLSTEGPASSSRSGTGSDVEGGKGKSKAWIAGPVIGVVAGLALVGAALFFWRRRKASVSASAAKRGLDATDDHDKPPAGVATAPPPHALQHQDTALSYGAAPAYTPFTPVEQNQNQNQNQVKAGGPGAFSYAQVQQHGPVEMHGETEIFEVPDTGFINGEKGARGGVHEM
jgi:hypothetical protein